jgi:hypothetical protein
VFGTREHLKEPIVWRADSRHAAKPRSGADGEPTYPPWSQRRADGAHLRGVGSIRRDSMVAHGDCRRECQVVPGRTYPFTRRCTQREFLFKPGARVAQAFLILSDPVRIYCPPSPCTRFSRARTTTRTPPPDEDVAGLGGLPSIAGSVRHRGPELGPGIDELAKHDGCGPARLAVMHHQRDDNRQTCRRGRLGEEAVPDADHVGP